MGDAGLEPATPSVSNSRGAERFGPKLKDCKGLTQHVRCVNTLQSKTSAGLIIRVRGWPEREFQGKQGKALTYASQ